MSYSFAGPLNLPITSFLSATNTRLYVKLWSKEEGLPRVIGTINLPNNI